jgi:probable rRNA maturation factor
VTERLLTVRNRQKRLKIDVSLLGNIAGWVLTEELGIASYELSLELVNTARITWLNEQFVRHRGPTDVITFDYASSEGVSDTCISSSPLLGDIIICVDEAVKQAARFRTSWQMELVRYAVHGVLHLLSFNDATTAQRRRMKVREDALLRAIAQRFPLSKLGRTGIRKH